MPHFTRLAMALAVALPIYSGAASAAAYTTTTIGKGADFAGCLAHNETTGVGFLAVGATVVIFGNSPKFPFAAGDMVTGSWSVDGGTPIAFSSKADSAHTVTLDVPNSAEVVKSLIQGDVLSVTANKIVVPFNLDGSDQAFSDLSTCMQTKRAP